DDMPVVQLAAAGSENGSDLLTTLNDEIIPALEGISGVRDVELVGIDDDIVTIELDNEKLAESGLSAQSVMAALEANGTPMPVGTIIEGDSELAISVGESLTSVDEIADLPLRGEALPALPEGVGEGEMPEGEVPEEAMPGAPTEEAPIVRLGDVAEIERVAAEPTSISRTNGQNSVGITITKTPDGNTVDVSQAVRDLLPELEQTLGEAGEISVIFDQAPFIEQSIEDLSTEGALGLVFAVLVILAFLLS